jgi:hypothetical protein
MGKKLTHARGKLLLIILRGWAVEEDELVLFIFVLWRGWRREVEG